MDSDTKMLKMFTEIHGEMSGSCTAQVQYNEDYEAVGVACVKDGQICWEMSKTDLVFEYITLNW